VTVPGGCRSQGCHGYPTRSALVLIVPTSSQSPSLSSSIVDEFNKRINKHLKEGDFFILDVTGQSHVHTKPFTSASQKDYRISILTTFIFFLTLNVMDIPVLCEYVHILNYLLLII